MKNTAKLLFAFMLVSGMISQGMAQAKWTLDKNHAGVKFTVTHLVISEVEGSFKAFTGSMTSSRPDFTDAQFDFSIDVASISTDNEMRDKHLKSDDFFNAEKYPAMTFKSISFKKLSAKAYELIGNLTIRDVTKKVKFQVTYGGQVKERSGNLKAGFKATCTINRLDYGVKWNALTEAGGAVVGKNVNIIINAEFAQQK